MAVLAPYPSAARESPCDHRAQVPDIVADIVEPAATFTGDTIGNVALVALGLAAIALARNARCPVLGLDQRQVDAFTSSPLVGRPNRGSG